MFVVVERRVLVGVGSVGNIGGEWYAGISSGVCGMVQFVI